MSDDGHIVQSCDQFGCCRGGVDAEVLAALLTHEGWLDRRGWDRRPELRWLVRHPHTGEVRAVPSGAPWKLYEEGAGRHYVIATRLASALPVLGTLPGLPDGLAGVMFTVEGWAVEAPGPDMPEAERKHVEALRAERRIHACAQRREVRYLEAVGLDGCEYAVGRQRGERPQSHTWAAGDVVDYRGDVVDALRELAAALRRHLGMPGPAPDFRTVFGLN